MFNWVINTPLILSSIIIWHAYGSIADSRFSGLCITHVFCILNIRNELTKKIYYKKIKLIASNAKTKVSLHLFQSVFKVYLQ